MSDRNGIMTTVWKKTYWLLVGS